MPPIVASCPSRMTVSLRSSTPACAAQRDDETARGRPPDRRETGFFDAARHNEALVLLCADALRMGRFEAAFMFADRRCRLVTPGAYDLLLRATASRLMNETRYAEGDLARAFETGPTHDLVIANVLAWGSPALQRLAATSFIEGELQDAETSRARDARLPVVGNAGRRENADSRGPVRGLGRLALEGRAQHDDLPERDERSLRARARFPPSPDDCGLVRGRNRN